MMAWPKGKKRGPRKPKEEPPPERKRQRGLVLKCDACGDGDMFVQSTRLDPRYPYHIAVRLPRMQYLKCGSCGATTKRIAPR